MEVSKGVSHHQAPQNGAHHQAGSLQLSVGCHHHAIIIKHTILEQGIRQLSWSSAIIKNIILEHGVGQPARSSAEGSAIKQPARGTSIRGSAGGSAEGSAIKQPPRGSIISGSALKRLSRGLSYQAAFKGFKQPGSIIRGPSSSTQQWGETGVAFWLAMVVPLFAEEL